MSLELVPFLALEEQTSELFLTREEEKEQWKRLLTRQQSTISYLFTGLQSFRVLKVGIVPFSTTNEQVIELVQVLPRSGISQVFHRGMLL